MKQLIAALRYHACKQTVTGFTLAIYLTISLGAFNPAGDLLRKYYGVSKRHSKTNISKSAGKHALALSLLKGCLAPVTLVMQFFVSHCLALLPLF